MPRWMVVVVATVALGSGTLTQDIPGSHDHPRVGRFAGAYIVGYSHKAFDEFALAVGPSSLDRGPTGNHRVPPEALDLEGEVTRILYGVSLEHSVAEVFRNYQKTLPALGFEELYSCRDKECGWDFANAYTMDREDLHEFPFGSGRASRRFLSARRIDREEGNEYVALMVYNNDSYTHDLRVQLEVVDEEPIDDQQIETKSASDLHEEIRQLGHSAVYGIYFGVDETTLGSESEPTLVEIAALLEQDTELRLYVVGHTDSTGKLDHNKQLSQRRAAAVVAALVNGHDIDAGRLAPFGVGPLAPVASNDTDAGRAHNRRVELVKQ